VSKELARQLIEAGVHFGHGTSRWNPKMAPYIFAKRGMIHIINVKETLKGLLIGKKLLTTVVSSGKDVIFVGTKRQAKKAVIASAKETGMHFIDNRWLGGALTNFRTIRSRVQRMEELEKMEQDGTIAAESKKRASQLKRELNKIRVNLDGLRNLNRMPGAMVIVDVKKEKNALAEAKKLGIPTIGIIDTDSNPDMVDIAIPANDDSTKGIELILAELSAAVAEGKTMARIQATAGEGDLRGRSKRRVRRADSEESSEAEAAQPEPAKAEASKEADAQQEPKEEPKVEQEAEVQKTEEPQKAEEVQNTEETQETAETQESEEDAKKTAEA
jgi:small subunit ribosomal protein S2